MGKMETRIPGLVEISWSAGENFGLHWKHLTAPVGEHVLSCER